jgi:hypothetical protein
MDLRGEDARTHHTALPSARHCNALLPRFDCRGELAAAQLFQKALGVWHGQGRTGDSIASELATRTTKVIITPSSCCTAANAATGLWLPRLHAVEAPRQSFHLIRSARREVVPLKIAV